MPDSNPPAGQDEPQVRYEEITKDAYAETAVNELTVTELTRGTLVVSGPCPRCRDYIETTLVENVFKLWRPGAGSPRAGAPSAREAGREEPMMCTCEGDHPDRPEGRSGCGAYWALIISRGAR